MRSKIIFSVLIYALAGGLMLPQTNLSLVLADEPITSPITNPITTPIVEPTPTPTPTPAPQSSNNSSNNSSSGSSGGGSAQAPVCGDSKPISVPKLVYASATGRNQVTLVWSKALDPVSYYLVAYGTKPGQLEYGNPNVGGRNTISYVVKGLENGKTYYFKVRAGNGCMPGEFSNELAVKVTGDNIATGPAVGFKAGVLGSIQQEMPFKPITSANPTRVVTSSVSLFTKILNFFTHLFKR